MLKPFFGYFGSKYRLIKNDRYDAALYNTVIEPFCGSASYALRYYDRNVILYDLNPIIAGMWSYLIHVKESEFLSLPVPELGSYLDDLHICQEAKWLIGFNVRSSVSDTINHVQGWGNSLKTWSKERIQGLASQLQYIRHWKVYQKSYTAIPISVLKATWFVDPPYQVQGKHYQCSSKHIDFQQLGDWCKSLKSQVMVCENEGADWLPFQILCQQKGHYRKTTEVIWRNQSHQRW